MSIAYNLPSKLRRKLKKPLGELIRGSFNETMDRLKFLVQTEKPPCVVSVGDVVSKNLMESQIHPRLLILDNKVMRSNIKPFPLKAEEERHVKNPPGTITFEAFNAVQEAFKANHRVKVVVEGEEDLLALAAILHAPLNSIIVYGQPQKGIVVVKATQQKKAEVAEILKAMQSVAKD